MIMLLTRIFLNFYSFILCTTQDFILMQRFYFFLFSLKKLPFLLDITDIRNFRNFSVSCQI